MPNRLIDSFGFTPVVATEIEFYLPGISAGRDPLHVVDDIRLLCESEKIGLASAEQERGPDQYEISLKPSRDVSDIIAQTDRFKSVLKAKFPQADFRAKPFADAPSSGLHIHIHLEDEMGKNVFFRNADETYSEELLFSLGGLMERMNPSMWIFAPTEQSYARFIDKSNVPTTVSWGTNNRTVALRLPTKPLHSKHIEHRVAGADADVGQVIQAIIDGIHYGLTYRIDPGAPTYGDASLAQYGLQPLARSLEEALTFKQ